MKSSTRLVLMFLIFSIVPMSVLSHFAYVNSVRSLKDASREHLEAVSELKADDLSRWFGSNARWIESTAQRAGLIALVTRIGELEEGSEELAAAREQLVSSYLLSSVTSSGLISLAVLDPSTGEVLASSMWEMEGTVYAAAPFFLKGRTGTYTGRFMVMPSSGTPMLHLSTPIWSDSGMLVGVLVGHADVDGLEGIMSLGSDHHHTEDSYLVDQDGLFITDPRFGEDYALVESANSDGVAAALLGETGVSEYVDYRGSAVLGAYRALPEWGLALITEIDLAEALAPIASLRRSILVVGLSAAFAMLVVSLLAARGLTTRLKKLSTAASQIGQGNLSARVPLTGADEVGQLAGAFNEMAENLKLVTTSRDELDSEIRRREQVEEERASQWNRFTAILASYPDLFYVADPENYEVLFVNRITEEILGRNPVGEPCYKAFQGFDAPCEFCTNKIILEERKPYEWQYYNPTMQKHFLITDQIIRWPDGRDVRFEVAKDITQYVKAQEERDMALAENTAIVESMRDGLVIVSLVGDVIDINPAFARMSGYSRDEIMSAARHEMLGKMFGPEDAAVYINALRVAAQGQIPDPAVVTLLTRSGDELRVSATASLLQGPGDGGVLVSLKDITPLMQAEKALRASEKKYRDLFEKAQIGMFRSKTDGSGLLDVNAKLCEIFGRSEEEMLALSATSLWADPGVREEVVRRLSSEGRVTDIEAEIMTASGERKTVLGTMTLYPDEAILEGSAMDITERRKAQGLAQKMNDELKRSNQELEQFAYVASHDLQEPLRMVASYTQLLERRYKDQLDDDARDFIHYAVDGANRMQRLINDLLEYSRVQTRGREFEPTDLNTLLGHARSNLTAAIEENKAVVSNDDLPTVPVDVLQMTSVLQNLIGNAIKFRGAEPPWVHVSAEERPAEWLISVKDNGIGIDPQFHERIFVIFQRLHGRAEYAGTGIGLALCKRIVERHGGRIWIESTPGEGATFYFTISKKGRL